MDSPDFPEIFYPSAGTPPGAGIPSGIRARLDIRLFPGHHTRRCHRGIPYIPLVAPEPDHNRIFTGDLALFMLNEMVKHQYSRMKVGISN